MAAEGSDEMPLIFATQTSATITDLDIDKLNFDDPTVTNIVSNITTGSMDSRTVSSPGRMRIARWCFYFPLSDWTYSLLLLVHLILEMCLPQLLPLYLDHPV